MSFTDIDISIRPFACHLESAVSIRRSRKNSEKLLTQKPKVVTLATFVRTLWQFLYAKLSTLSCVSGCLCFSIQNLPISVR
jgi:hypothetical protein